MRSLIATENQEQIALIEWASYHPICSEYLIHIENERECTEAQGKLRKLKGVKAGVVDLFLAYPTKRYAGFWIEMKRRGARPSLKQKNWIKKMIERGYAANWFDNWEEAKENIEEYLR